MFAAARNVATPSTLRWQLEPGEIDQERYRTFTKCVRDEARRNARAAAEAKAKAKRNAAAEAAGTPLPPDSESESGSGDQADDDATDEQ